VRKHKEKKYIVRVHIFIPLQSIITPKLHF